MCSSDLATPMSIMVGVGRGAAAGILIRNAEALERLEKVDTLVIDKTGTLTEGKPRITNVTGGIEMLRLAASLERGSEHPIARMIVDAALERRQQLSPVSDFRAEAGRGVSGTVEGKKMILGTARLLKENGVDLGSFQRPVMLAVDGLWGRTFSFEALCPTSAGADRGLLATLANGAFALRVTGHQRSTAHRTPSAESSSTMPAAFSSSRMASAAA